MKVSLTLTEADIRQAILEYAKKQKGIEFKYVHLNYTAADSRDPREQSYHTATVSE